jgi:hypothetical protein
MKRYFTRITADHWVAKNKLAEEAKQLALRMERLLLHEDTLQLYKDTFSQAVKDLNDKYHRCKPLVLHIWKIPDTRTNRWSYSIYSVFDIEVIELQGEM